MNANIFAITALFLGLMLMAGTGYAQAPASGPCPAALPVGSWTLSANGHQGTLNVTAMNVATGEITGGFLSLTGGVVDHIRGFWTASACRITFIRFTGNNVALQNATVMQTYTGYAYPASSGNPFGQKRLAGEFQTFSPNAGGSSARNVFGWDAFKY